MALSNRLTQEIKLSEREQGKRPDWLDRVDVMDFLEKLDIANITMATSSEVKFSCPFSGHTHGDEEPSAYMNTGAKDKKKATAFMCHGCKRSGNAITFYAEHQSVSKSEAKTHLREEYAPDFRTPKGGSISAEFEMRQEERQKTEEFVDQEIDWDRYDEFFGIDWPLGAGARDFEGDPVGYMYARGFTSETLRKWRIGYDEVSDRITIPVCNEDGVCIGVKGRAWHKGVRPKYKILGDKGTRRNRYGFKPYDKSRWIFGVHFLEDRWAAMWEGELDIIACDQAGIPALSTGSAHLSDFQARLIRNLIDTGVLCFDNNTAGDNATYGYFDKDGDWHEGAIGKLEPFIKVKVAPEHKWDAADHIEKNKLKKLRRLIDSAVPSSQIDVRTRTVL